MLPSFFTLLISISWLLSTAEAQLGVSGTQAEVCSAACYISVACQDCLNLPNDYDESAGNATVFRCLCQDSCVDFRRVCYSCCEATTTLGTPRGYCFDRNLEDLFECRFGIGIEWDQEAAIYSEIGFTATAPLPSAQASYVSQLTSPRDITLTSPIGTLTGGQTGATTQRITATRSGSALTGATPAASSTTVTSLPTNAISSLIASISAAASPSSTGAASTLYIPRRQLWWLGLVSVLLGRAMNA